MEYDKELKNYKCIFCNTLEQKCLGVNPDFQSSSIFHCKNCKSIYTYPVPTDELLEAIYLKHYREVRNETPNPEYKRIMLMRAQAQKKIIAKYFFGRNRCLDIGSGAGILLNEFKSDFDYIEGYEPDSIMYLESIKYKSKNTSIYNSICKVNDLMDNSYDLITLSHVFEHIPNPKPFLNTLLKKLTKNGIIFIEIPNESIDTVKEQIDFRSKGLMHINYFNKKSFLNVFGGMGEIQLIQQYGVSNKLFRVVKPNSTRIFRYLYHRLFKAAPGFFVHLGMLNIDDRSNIYNAFNQPNNSGVYLRIIIKRKR